jgi:glutathione S-transferase
MKLYGTLTSPFVRKARILVLEKQIKCEQVVAAPGGPDSPVSKLNPLGLIPVLERDDGSVLFDSPVIVEYLDSLKAPALIPPSGESRWSTLRWAALADGIMDQAVARLYETRRPMLQQSVESLRSRDEKIAHALDFAEQQLPRGAYLVEDRLTIADIGLATALEYIDFRHPHDWRGPRPRLAGWLAAIGTRPAIVQTRPS